MTTLLAPRQIAVAIHAIQPSSFERCALIRDWLDDHGVDRVTLLVAPASDLHPFHDRRPELAEWISERTRAGDAVAQYGFQLRQAHPPSGLIRTITRGHARGPGCPEFVGLDEAETRRAVQAGRRVLKLAGVTPRGFVAPAYAYTAGLERALAPSFDWWASLHRVHTDHGRRSSYLPSLTVGDGGGARIAGRLSTPWGVRTSALFAGPLLRLDIHPDDLDLPGRIGAAESVLRRAGRREAVTYDDLAAAHA